MSFRPKFDKGLILKQHMLEALRDNPQDYIGLMYADMGDGIISGLDITVPEDGKFYISPGIIKINNEIFFSTKNGSLKFLEGANYVYLQILKEEKTDGTEYQIEFVQKQQEEDTLFEVFRYVKSAEMMNYKNMQEVFLNPMNRIDCSHVKQSLIGGSTLHKMYFGMYADEVLRNKNSEMGDIAFVYQCLNGISNIEVIKNYFQTEDFTNESVLALMKKRLLELDSNRVEEKVIKKVPKEERKMIIS